MLDEYGTAERVFILAGIAIGSLVVIFLFTFPTGWAPHWVLSAEARLVRLLKKRKSWNWTYIEPGIILGSLPTMLCHLDELKTEGVGAVLTLNESWELYMLQKCVEDSDLLSRQLPTPDFFAPRQKDIIEAVNFMRSCIQKGMSVYVHCNGGKGRSAVCVICYLIFEHNWTPDEAYSYVKEKRKIASLKAWCGLHKQWRAVKRFHRELQRARKQEGNGSCFTSGAPSKPSSKVAPLQDANYSPAPVPPVRDGSEKLDQQPSTRSCEVQPAPSLLS
jgi:atypical dual specificity phosphatase